MSIIPFGKAEGNPQPAASSLRGPRRRATLLPLLLGAAVLASGCGQGQGPARAPKAVEVIVTTPVKAAVADYQDFTGRLSAVRTVEIRARVTGYITEAPFTEGARVKEGDILFRIDPRSYRADLNLAKANLKLAEAQRTVQQKLASRSERLIGGGNVAREDYEQTVATLEKDKASVEAMQANVDRAQLFLDWATVRAPFSGRISRRMADPGNLVLADNTILTTVVAENPLWAYFDVDERTFLGLTGRKSPSPELSTSLQKAHLPVLMRLANEEEFTQVGEIDFIDNQVTPTTGTIRFRGIFPNPGLALKPGLFARVRLPIGAAYQAILIPDEALQNDQGRKFVYVVNDKNEVVYRKVQTGQAIKTLRVIKEGVAEGERVIVVGQQRVRPETKVTPTVRPAPKPPEAPLVKLLAAKRPAPEATGQAPPEPPAPAGGAGQAEPRTRPTAHQGGGSVAPRHAGR